MIRPLSITQGKPRGIRLSSSCLVCGNNANLKSNQGIHIMAFNKRNTSNTAQETNTSNEREPRTTIGYVNIGIPLTDGTTIKIAGDLTLRLFAENPGHVQLVEAIRNGDITTEEASNMIVASISLARDPDAALELDWSRIGK